MLYINDCINDFTSTGYGVITPNTHSHIHTHSLIRSLTHLEREAMKGRFRAGERGGGRGGRVLLLFLCGLRFLDL